MVSHHVNVTEARSILKDLVNRVFHNGERIALDRYGHTEAVLISPQEAVLLEKLEDFLDIRAAEEALENFDGVDWETARKELGL